MFRACLISVTLVSKSWEMFFHQRGFAAWKGRGDLLPSKSLYIHVWTGNLHACIYTWVGCGGQLSTFLLYWGLYFSLRMLFIINWSQVVCASLPMIGCLGKSSGEAHMIICGSSGLYWFTKCFLSVCTFRSARRYCSCVMIISPGDVTIFGSAEMWGELPGWSCQ